MRDIKIIEASKRSLAKLVESVIRWDGRASLFYLKSIEKKLDKLAKNCSQDSGNLNKKPILRA